MTGAECNSSSTASVTSANAQLTADGFLIGHHLCSDLPFQALGRRAVAERGRALPS